MYSGDVTNAPTGATELLYTKKGLSAPALSVLNIFNGRRGCKFKFVIGTATKVKANYMFDPNELILELESTMKARQQILGLFMPEEEGRLSFTIIDTGFGNIGVSSNSVLSMDAMNALYYQYHSPISLKSLLKDAGAEIIYEGNADIDLSPGNLSKDTFINLLS